MTCATALRCAKHTFNSNRALQVGPACIVAWLHVLSVQLDPKCVNARNAPTQECPLHVAAALAPAHEDGIKICELLLAAGAYAEAHSPHPPTPCTYL